MMFMGPHIRIRDVVGSTERWVSQCHTNASQRAQSGLQSLAAPYELEGTCVLVRIGGALGFNLSLQEDNAPHAGNAALLESRGIFLPNSSDLNHVHSSSNSPMEKCWQQGTVSSSDRTFFRLHGSAAVCNHQVCVSHQRPLPPPLLWHKL